MMARKKADLIEIDFHEHDTIALLRFLLNLSEQGRVAGLVYGVSVIGREQPIYGVTGRVASSPLKSAGLAASLASHMCNAITAPCAIKR